MAVLLIAEHDNSALNPAMLNAMTAAAQMGDVDVLVAGHNCADAASAAASIPGVRAVIQVDDPAYANAMAESLSDLIVSMASDYDAVVAASTSLGKNVLPRVAALMDVAQLSDIVAVIDGETFQRYIYAGNALSTVKCADSPKMITVRTTAFDAASAEGGSASVSAGAAVAASTLSSYVGSEVSSSERPDLASAKIVVSGGRGMGSGENFALLEALADKLGAAVGASRAAVDAGFVPNEYQVGQTGKVVAPDLYIAVGISGAIQHLAGMKDSKIIVAINKDDEAPIFQVADFGLVADLFDAVPAMTAGLD